MWVLLSLLGCPAEQLGVPLPTGGGEVLKAEDLRRDARGFVDWPVADFFRERMEKMDVDELREGEGWSCAFREGVEGAETRILRAPWPLDVDSAVSAAVLISLAKAWNRPTPLTHPTWMCIVAEGATGHPDGKLIQIGPFNAGALELGDHIHAGEPNPAATLGELNSDWLKRQVLTIWDSLEGRKPARPEPQRRAPPRR